MFNWNFLCCLNERKKKKTDDTALLYEVVSQNIKSNCMAITQTVAKKKKILSTYSKKVKQKNTPTFPATAYYN